MTRVIALDVGDKRIGVAISDPTRFLASPLCTVERDASSSEIQQIEKLVENHEASELLVGMPLQLSGRKGIQARLVESFMKILANHLSIPIKSVDERLSTLEAERMLRQAGKSPSSDKHLVDSVSAVIILQSYLDAN